MSLLAIYMPSGLTGVGIGIATPLITVGLSIIGDRLAHAQVGSGNSLYTTAYSLGSIVGPVSASAL